MLESRQQQNSRPPLLVGERGVWLGSGSGLPQAGFVRWVGKLQGMGPGWTVGLELDRPLPYGGIDGSWCGRQLFQCRTKHGLLVPASVVVKEDALLRTFGISPVALGKPPPSQQQLEPKSEVSEAPSIVKPKRSNKHSSSDSRPSSQQSVKPSQKTTQKTAPPLASPPLQVATKTAPPLQSLTNQQSTTPPVELATKTDSENCINQTEPKQEPKVLAKSVANHRKHTKAPLPPPKAGYFHTAPARPNRHLRGHKPSSSASLTEKPPEQEDIQPPEQEETLPPVQDNNQNEEHRAWSSVDTPPRVPVRRHNSLNSSRNSSDLVETTAGPSADELIYQWFDASDSTPTAPPRIRPKSMNTAHSPSLSPSSSTSSFGDAIAAAEAIYSERLKKHLSVESTSSISSTSSSHRKSGGFLSFLRWLRRGGGSESSEEKVNELSHAGSTNSLGTVVSAASSFAYIGPNAFLHPENRASLHYAHNPSESETYKNRIKQRDHARRLDKNLTFKRKYKLKQFACSQETVFNGTLKPTQINKSATGSGRRSRKGPAPPIPVNKSEHYTDCSLPASLLHRPMDDKESPVVKLHRRTNSESSKDKRAGAYCHVRGKRKAPAPPAVIKTTSALASRFKNPFPSFGRKKRQAPIPPDNIDETSKQLSNDEKQRLISNINKLRSHAAGKNDRLQGPAVVIAPPTVMTCTNEPTSGMKAPLSPKPWFKRSSSKSSKHEKKEKKDDEEMPDVSYVRVLPAPEEGKRKSLQLSMLASISELDREAAEIVQNQHKRAAELIAARNNSFYLPPPDTPTTPTISEPDTLTPAPSTPESPTPRPQTKSLISMFNAITNVSKVTVNTSTAAIAGFFSGETRRNRISQTFSAVEEQDEEENSSATTTEVTQTSQSVVVATSKTIQVNSSHVYKDTTTTNNIESSEKELPKHDNSDNVKNKVSLYPQLAEPVVEDPKEPPLPLSISGIPDGVSLTRQKKVVWTCSRCTLENPRWRLTCDACDMWRPSSLHKEKTPTYLQNNIHAAAVEEPTSDEETKIDDEFKRPEPIGPIDWESELKRYFEPPQRNAVKSPEPLRKVSPLKTSKVGEAIRNLESKQTVVEITKPKLFKSKTETSVIQEKEPEYAAVSANKKMPTASTSKTPDSPKITPKSPERKMRVEKLAENKIIIPVKTTEISVKAETKVNGFDKSPDKSDAVKTPDTFIGGRTKADEQKNTKVTTITPDTKEPLETKTADIDEVRKARLAFFNKPQDSIESGDALPPASPRLGRAKQCVGVSDIPSSPRLVRTVEIATDTKELSQIKSAIASPAITPADRDEKMKLREKLREMKNSLPKHDDNYQSIYDAKQDTGAIKKTRPLSCISLKSDYGYENIPKKVVNKPLKVSTSVQTGGPRKPKLEEPTDSGNIKNGKIYTSLSKSPSFRGTGTFELIGAKDFATIEATKSNKPSATTTVQHVYANIPSPGLVQETKIVPVKTPQQVPPPNQVVVKVEPKVDQDPQEDDDDLFDDEEILLDDQSSMSGAASVAGSVGDSNDIEKLAGLLTRPKGLAEFKADLAASQQSGTLAVNRLLRRLEAAIANGQHRIAAGLARDLARLKVSCSVIRQRKNIEPELFTVDMYVEDKVSHQGPIPLSVCAAMTVGELKIKVQHEFEIPANVQRWILGKQLAADDSKTLQQHSVAAAGCTVFLYLVAPPDRNDSSSPATEPSAPILTPTTEEPASPRMVPTVEPPRGPGWYYNFEEDRYSYCESSDDESEPEEVQEITPDKPVVVEVPPTPVAAPVIPLAQEEETESSEEEEEEEEEEEDEGPGVAGGLIPTAPPATLPPEKKTGTLVLGWRCPVCTLINPPTRPGCAACTTERPVEYRVPGNYQVSDDEAHRLQREAELEQADEAAENGQVDNYAALVALDNQDLVSNVEAFECPVCFVGFAPGEGAMLRECLHTFCRACLAHTAQFSEEVEVHCPFRNQQYACDAILQEREVRALVPPEIYERMQAKSVAQAENKIQNAFHCKTPDCRGWCIFEDNVNDFRCPVCGHHNCLTCQSIHDGINCRQYQERVTQASDTDAEAKRTRDMLEEMVQRGEALVCPTCQVVLMKKWGCDWLRCSMCKTEICWVTRGPRWGPGGKGDTNGGCKCGINGIKCHPKCNYCH